MLLRKRANKQMKIDLGKLPPEKSQEFLNYFKAGLRKASDTPLPPTGGAWFNKKGEYETYLEGNMRNEDIRNVRFIWKIVQKEDGSIPFIEATPQDESSDKSTWESLVQSFIQEVMVSTLAESKHRFFKRSFVHYLGPTLDGEYWISGFRFAPLIPNDENPHLMSAERIFVIDQEVDAIDDFHANMVAEEQAKTISAQLSLILNIGLFEQQHEHRWVIYQPDNSSEVRSGRFQLGYWEKPNQNTMPKKRELCNLGKYERSVYEYDKPISLTTCPIEARRILRGLKNCEIKKQIAFNNCARLYQIAMNEGRYMPSLNVSYKVGAIDAIANSYGKQWKDFMREIIPDIDNNILDYLYGTVRSAHWHSGALPMRENDPRTSDLTNPNHINIFMKRRKAESILRKGIITWVMNEIAEPDNSKK